MAASRSGGKSAAAFRTISEVSEELDVPQHVLRFWETKFNQVKPLKRGGGRRYYRPEDVELLRRIRGLLYNDGYTIKGVQKLLREHGGRAPLPHDEAGLPPAPPLNGGPEPDEPSSRVRSSEGTRRAPKRSELETAISELRALSDRLKSFSR